MAEPDDDASDDLAMRKRLSALGRDLSNGPAGPVADRQPTKGPSGFGDAVSLGMRVTSEFVAAVAVSGFIGWQLDRWLHSSPAALIILMALGTAAGFWNVYRIAARTGRR